MAYNVSTMFFYLFIFVSDVTDWLSAMVSSNKWANAVSVFSVKKRLPYEDCTSHPIQLGYSSIDMVQNTNGEFDISEGTFIVKIPGIYLFHLSGYCRFSECHTEPGGSIQLRVNGCPVSFQTVTYDDYDSEEHADLEQDPKPIALSTFVSLKTGDRVNSFSEDLHLHEKEDTYTTRFSGVYFSD